MPNLPISQWKTNKTSFYGECVMQRFCLKRSRDSGSVTNVSNKRHVISEAFSPALKSGLKSTSRQLLKHDQISIFKQPPLLIYQSNKMFYLKPRIIRHGVTQSVIFLLYSPKADKNIIFWDKLCYLQLTCLTNTAWSRYNTLCSK